MRVHKIPDLRSSYFPEGMAQGHFFAQSVLNKHAFNYNVLYGLHRGGQMKFKIQTHRNPKPEARSISSAVCNNAQQYSSATLASLPYHYRKLQFGARLKNITISDFYFTFLHMRQSEIA